MGPRLLLEMIRERERERGVGRPLLARRPGPSRQPCLPIFGTILLQIRHDRICDSDAPGTIELRVFRALVGRDWCWWRTVTQNLDRIRSVLAEGPRSVIEGGEIDPIRQLDALTQAAGEAAKSRRWRLRSRVADRGRWYELPEEEPH